MDELKRVHDLSGDPPEPDPVRKARARDELLAMAEEETSATPQRPGRLAELLERAREWLPRPVPAVGVAAVAIIGLAVAGALLAGPLTSATDDQPVVADRGDAPSVAEEPDADVQPSPDGPTPDEPTPDEPAPDPDVELELAAHCSDPDGHYSIRYPQEWFTPDPGDEGACRFFAPEPFEVDAAIGGQTIADIELSVEPTQLDQFAEPGPDLELRTSEDLEVDGRPAVHQQLRATGDGGYPQGTLVRRYLVDLDDATLVAGVTAEDQDELDDAGQVLERMVDALTIDET